MATAAPQRLLIPQIAEIHLNHKPTALAIQTIVDFINKNVNPVQGNKVAPRR